MKSNVGGIDRMVRIVGGLILIGLAASGMVGWWGWLGIIALVTGLVRWCPAWMLLGIDTAQASKAPEA